jgi:iron-sulfur cluster repair protein YtfE (RIC family)
MKTPPIKRNKALIQVSRDHHHGLLLCWKIRTGFSKGIEFERIKRYTDWFFETHLVPHFNLEERYIFPILGNKNKLIKKALSEHNQLIRLFSDDHEIENSLHNIEVALEQHIRFEERVLFNEIQNIATQAQLKIISELHNKTNVQDNTEDEFWK